MTEQPQSSYTSPAAFSLFFFQAEDGIRDVERSRGLGDVYKRQKLSYTSHNTKKIDTSGTELSLSKEIDNLIDA